MLPVSLLPVVWLVILGVVGGALFWLVDAIGDRREYKVRAEYAEAARKKNIEIGNFNSADDAVAAVVEAALKAKSAEAAGVNAPECPATKEQARALTAIRRLK